MVCPRLKLPHSTSENSLESMLTAAKVYPSIPPPGKRQEVLMRTKKGGRTVRPNNNPVQPTACETKVRPQLQGRPGSPASGQFGDQICVLFPLL